VDKARYWNSIDGENFLIIVLGALFQSVNGMREALADREDAINNHSIDAFLDLELEKHISMTPTQ